MKIIVNNNITLSPVCINDSIDLFNATNKFRRELRTWLPWVDLTKKQSDTEFFIRSVTESKCAKKDYIFVIRYNKELAGLVALKEVDTLNKRTEIGYWLLPNMEGKGIMTQSCKTLIDYAFIELGINKIQIKCAIKNQKSINIPKRLNFNFEGTEREGENLNGKFVDLYLYSLLKSEWKA